MCICVLMSRAWLGRKKAHYWKWGGRTLCVSAATVLVLSTYVRDHVQRYISPDDSKSSSVPRSAAYHGETSFQTREPTLKPIIGYLRGTGTYGHNTAPCTVF